MQTAVEKHEAYLLRKESRIRRDRYLAFWYGLFMIAFHAWVTWTDLPDADNVFIWIGVFSLLYSYITHLKVQHIESIKFHHEACDPLIENR